MNFILKILRVFIKYLLIGAALGGLIYGISLIRKSPTPPSPPPPTPPSPPPPTVKPANAPNILRGWLPEPTYKKLFEDSPTSRARISLHVKNGTVQSFVGAPRNENGCAMSDQTVNLINTLTSTDAGGSGADGVYCYNISYCDPDRDCWIKPEWYKNGGSWIPSGKHYYHAGGRIPYSIRWLQYANYMGNTLQFFQYKGSMQHFYTDKIHYSTESSFLDGNHNCKGCLYPHKDSPPR